MRIKEADQGQYGMMNAWSFWGLFIPLEQVPSIVVSQLERRSPDITMLVVLQVQKEFPCGIVSRNLLHIVDRHSL